MLAIFGLFKFCLVFLFFWQLPWSSDWGWSKPGHKSGQERDVASPHMYPDEIFSGRNCFSYYGAWSICSENHLNKKKKVRDGVVSNNGQSKRPNVDKSEVLMPAPAFFGFCLFFNHSVPNYNQEKQLYYLLTNSGIRRLDILVFHASHYVRSGNQTALKTDSTV